MEMQWKQPQGAAPTETTRARGRGSLGRYSPTPMSRASRAGSARSAADGPS